MIGLTAGEFVYLIRADRSQLNKTLDESEKGVKQWGNKISAWTVAKGQMIGQFATKAITKITDITSAMMKNTIKAYGTFEQLQGGAELLFGSAYDKIMKKAAEAYHTVQMSANDYLDAVNGYAVGLKTSLGNDENAAADLADRIITAQADIVAATGRSREAVQNAFAGVMRGNYMMLDNLGLGIKGSQEGMKDVIKKVNDWNKAMGHATKYQLGNLADMENALVDYVEMVGMAGYAEKEASKTLEGTMQSTKAAWENLLVAFGSGKDVKKATQNLAESAKKMLKNVLPVAKNTIQSIGDFVTEMIPEVGKWITNLSEELKKSPNPIVKFIGDGIDFVSTALQGATALVTDFEGTVNRLKESDDPMAQFIGNTLQTIKDIFQWIIDNQEPIALAVGAIVGAFAVGKITAFLMNLNPVTVLLGAIAGAATLIVTNWDSIKETVIGIWDSIKKSVENAWESVKGWFKDRTSEISAAWSTIANWFNDNVWQPVAEFFTASWETISKLWTGVKESISQTWSTIANWFRDTVCEPIKSFFEDPLGAISQLWTDIKTKISEAWNGVKEILDPIIEPIRQLFQGLVDTVSGIWNTLQSIFGLGDKNIDVNVNYHETGREVLPDGTIITEYENGGRGVDHPDGSGGAGHSFAKGAWTVPYDMTARVHRGERIMTASQARQSDQIDYTIVAQMIGESIDNAFDKLGVFLNGNKVGDMTSRRVGNNIRVKDYSECKAMGG